LRCCPQSDCLSDVFEHPINPSEQPFIGWNESNIQSHSPKHHSLQVNKRDYDRIAILLEEQPEYIRTRTISIPDQKAKNSKYGDYFEMRPKTYTTPLHEYLSRDDNNLCGLTGSFRLRENKETCSYA
jgi:hypothetical protein